LFPVEGVASEVQTSIEKKGTGPGISFRRKFWGQKERTAQATSDDVDKRRIRGVMVK
jgi:hypothetical protein